MRDQLTNEPGLMSASEIVNRVIAAIILATLSGLAGAVLASQSGQPTTSADPLDARNSRHAGPVMTGGTGAAGQPGRFTVVDLAVAPAAAPGATQLRWARITNPTADDIVVTRLTAAAALPATPAGATTTCLPSDLSVEPLNRPVRVRAGGTAEVALVTRLSGTAPPACQGAHFPLTYAGVASRS